MSFLKRSRHYLVLIAIFLCLLNARCITSEEQILPSPITDGSNSLLDILGFGSEELFGRKVLPTFNSSKLAQLLWAMQGLSHAPFRTVPSAGGTYPLDVFTALTVEVSSLKTGLYRYLPNHHSLQEWNNTVPSHELYSQMIDMDSEVNLSSAPVSFFITAEYSRTTTRYGQRGERYVHLEVGHLLQNLRIQAKTLDIHLEYYFNLNETLIQSVLNVDFVPMFLCFAWELGTHHDEVGNRRLMLNGEEISVESAIQNRQSIREYLETPLAKHVITSLLRYSVYSEDPFTGKTVFYSLTKNASVNVYLSISSAKNLNSGIYKFDFETKIFTQISNFSKSDEIYEVSLQQNWVKNSPMRIILTIDNKPIAAEIARRVRQMEVGVVAQNLYLATQAFGLGMVVVGAFHDSEIHQLLSLSNFEDPMYVIPMGNLVETSGPLFTSLNISFWSAFFGWITILMFYLACLIKTVPLKDRIPNSRLFHLVSGLLAGIFALFHLVLRHGGWLVIISPSWSSIKNLITSTLFSFPSYQDFSLNNLSLDLARISAYLFVVFGVLAFLVYYSIIKQANEWINFLHRYFGHFIMLSMIFHGVVNGTWFNFYGIISWFILIPLMLTYVIAYNSSFIEKSTRYIRLRFKMK